ncbi:MAG: sulfatase [Mailhella sp.]|nr:sulfatase [Mailhella sp.]
MLKNAIVVMFDSLQFNYLGCYGNEWIKTPNMDRFAAEGVLFENCYTEGLPTVPCRRSMHTGRFYIHKSGWCPLEMEDTTIADLCWGRPIDTALVFDCPMYRLPKFGYTRGFDKVWFTHGHELDHFFYEKDPLYHFKPSEFYSEQSVARARKHLGDKTVDFNMAEIDGYLAQMQYWKGPEDRYVARTIRKAVEYLEQVDRNKQFFLWIDSFDPHEPWNPPSVYMRTPCPYDPDYKGVDEFLPFLGMSDELYTDAETNHVRMLYAELVTLCDTYFGVLTDAIRRLGFEENTLVMMVSDHGEPMGNGEHGHGIIRKCRPWPYEELTHTPILMRYPGCQAGKRVPALIQSCDIAPTVTEWLGIGVHPQMTGKSLLPLANGEVDKIRDWALAGYYRGGVAYITEDWYYIHWMCDGKMDVDWLKDVGENMAKSSAANAQMDGSSAMFTDGHAAKIDEPEEASAAERTKEVYTQDGNDMWTCTPGSTFVMPEEDELYARKADPFQLHNIAKENPDVVKKLLGEFNAIMEDLRAS